ncbi:MAG: 3-dehydroquinate synthase, partial [Candidatus Omnitrophica bacterium]|nr:3-dehydroquinate synthase [Candidatus Omnitrophota bacterium]
MSTNIPVRLKNNPYNITVGSGILGQLPKFIRHLGLGKDVVIITHVRLERLHWGKLAAGLKKAGYSVKTFTVPE